MTLRDTLLINLFNKPWLPIYLLQADCVPGAGDREQKRTGPAREVLTVWWGWGEHVQGRHPNNQGGHIRVVVHTKGSKDPEQGETFERTGEQLKLLVSFKNRRSKAPSSGLCSQPSAEKPLSQCLHSFEDLAGQSASLEQAATKSLSLSPLGTKCKVVSVATLKAPLSNLGLSTIQLIFCSPSVWLLSIPLSPGSELKRKWMWFTGSPRKTLTHAHTHTLFYTTLRHPQVSPTDNSADGASPSPGPIPISWQPALPAYRSDTMLSARSLVTSQTPNPMDSLLELDPTSCHIAGHIFLKCFIWHLYPCKVLIPCGRLKNGHQKIATSYCLEPMNITLNGKRSWGWWLSKNP